MPAHGDIVVNNMSEVPLMPNGTAAVFVQDVGNAGSDLDSEKTWPLGLQKLLLLR